MKTIKLEYKLADGETVQSKSFNVLEAVDTDIQGFANGFNTYTTNTVQHAYKRGDFEEVELV